MYGIIRLPVAQFGALSVGPSGGWLSIAATNLVGAVLAYAWYRRGTWRHTARSTRKQRTETRPGDD